MTVEGCFLGRHDPVLLSAAISICILSSLTAMDLIHHAKTSGPRLRRIWLTVAGIAGGCGIWATHFIAMMAFESVLPTGYDIALTVASLAIVVSMTTAGLLVALSASSLMRPWLGGGIVGLGLAAMHQVGLAAFRTSGALDYDLSMMAFSMLLGIPLASWAIAMKVSGQRRFVRIRSAALLVLAICSLHFVSMAGITIRPDPLIVVPATALSRHWLALSVGGTGLGMLALAGLALFLDNRERLRREQFDLVLSLANAAVEGILVCENERIVVANTSFAMLLGRPAEGLLGQRVSDVIASPPIAGSTTEQEIIAASGETIPVEVIRHEIATRGRRRHAIAVRDLRARRQAERRIRHLAHHDALTGLPNRASFTARLDQEMGQATRNGRLVGLLFLDLDRFKDVNDSFGHAAGDALLLAIASGVTGSLDETQMLARLGGDEFAVILPGLADAAVAGRIAERIIETVRSSVVNLPAGGVIGTSIGIAIFPSDATERSTLLNHADLALYQAKAEGRGIYRFFEAVMGQQALERRQIERDLRLAVARGELHLVYQPQRSVRTGDVTGFEALVRWRHPTRGDVPPSVFIPIAEETGLIHPLGAMVLRQACSEVAPRTGLRVAVNVSVLQVHCEGFAGLVRDVLSETKLEPERLELEITETALIRDFERALRTIRQIKALGVQITMDDFGTGYSSLSNLRNFPFDKIKIDRSFVRAVDTNQEGAAIVRAVLSLGRGLGLPVLAEGVETPQELSFLTAEACDEVQGYLLGRPAAMPGPL